jgi:ADP-ribose pyrophosphatase
MKTVEIQSRHRILDGFLKIDDVEFRHQRRDGSMSPLLRRLHLDRGDGVAAVLHNAAQGTLLFVRQFRYSTYENGPGWLLETVAGIVEPGQTPEESVIREVREETGYRIRDLEPVSVFYLTPGGSSERIHLFYAEVETAAREHEGGGLAEEGEDIEVVELTLEQVWQALDRGAIADAKTIVGLQWLRRRLELNA